MLVITIEKNKKRTDRYAYVPLFSKYNSISQITILTAVFIAMRELIRRVVKVVF